MLKIGFCITGSFCTIAKIYPIISKLIDDGAEVWPILSYNAAKTDTRFGKAEDMTEKLTALTGHAPMATINEVEPIGPGRMLDVLVIEPCTGNTAAKIAGGISDTPVTLAVKSHLRNNRPVVIAVSTNDGLSGNAANIGTLLQRKNIFIIPFKQDNCTEKENSIISDFDLTADAITAAIKGRQLQPLLIT